mgnify:CR=1 FL=1
MSVIETSTRSDDVMRLLNEKLIPAMAGQPRATAAGAMLMLIITSMKPDIDGDQLYACVLDTSAYMVTWLSGTESGQAIN